MDPHLQLRFGDSEPYDPHARGGEPVHVDPYAATPVLRGLTINQVCLMNGRRRISGNRAFYEQAAPNCGRKFLRTGLRVYRHTMAHSVAGRKIRTRAHNRPKIVPVDKHGQYLLL